MNKICILHFLSKFKFKINIKMYQFTKSSGFPHIEEIKFSNACIQFTSIVIDTIIILLSSVLHCNWAKLSLLSTTMNVNFVTMMKRNSWIEHEYWILDIIFEIFHLLYACIMMTWVGKFNKSKIFYDWIVIGAHLQRTLHMNI